LAKSKSANQNWLEQPVKFSQLVKAHLTKKKTNQR
jgi:hypothetical protein